MQSRPQEIVLIWPLLRRERGRECGLLLCAGYRALVFLAPAITSDERESLGVSRGRKNGAVEIVFLEALRQDLFKYESCSLLKKENIYIGRRKQECVHDT